MNFLLVVALQYYAGKFGNPSRVYINADNIISLTAHLEYVCSDPEYKKCSKKVQEVCEVNLGYHHSEYIKGSCADFINKLKEAL